MPRYTEFNERRYMRAQGKKLEHGAMVVLTAPLWLAALWVLGEIAKALGWHR